MLGGSIEPLRPGAQSVMCSSLEEPLFEGIKVTVVGSPGSCVSEPLQEPADCLSHSCILFGDDACHCVGVLPSRSSLELN